MKKIESALKNNDYFGYGLTDENVLYGLPSFDELMNKNHLPFILGMSMILEENEYVLYIVNEEGYKNIIAISYAINHEELTASFLKEHSEGLIGVLETNRGKFKELFLSLDKVDTSFNRYLLEISELFKTFYLGIEVTSKEEVNYANKIRKFANEYTYELVALPRIRYMKKEDAIAVDIVKSIQINDTLDKKNNIGQEYFLKEIDYHKIYTNTEIDNTNKIISLNEFSLHKTRGEMLHYPCENSDDELRKKAYDKLKLLSLDNNEIYNTRLDYELSVISKMGYSNYFLIVQDYISWARNNDILVGPGRGSAAGCLVGYLLGISEIDPLQYDLQFERFLNPNRTTMPDIDVDFMDNRRDEVIQYLRNKYGSSRVSNILAIQTIGAKQSLRDIGRIYKIPERHISLLCKNITGIDMTLGQAYKYNPEFKKLCDSDVYFKEIVSLAGKIEGLPRQSSIHASGVILNNVDLKEVVPVSTDLDDNYITQYEGKYLEEQGFLKMDFLGNRNLTTIHYCAQLIKKNHPEDNFNVNDIPYDRKEIFSLIRSGQTIGLFQINTPTMQKAIKIVQPSNFDDVVALLALNRPATMSYLKNYADRRDGKEKVNYLSEDLKEILSPTYGIIIYQEQVNKIATKVAGMDPGSADMFRRAISKKDKDIIESNKKTFIEGCLKNGYNEKTALDMFNHVLKFAEYGFNKSHSVVYSVITCRMAYLKAHYPLEFYSAILQTGTTNELKFSDYISEMKKRNIKMRLPSINHSSLLFEVKDDGLLFPFSSIRGLNAIMAANIIEERKNGLFTDFFNFVCRLYPYKINEAQIVSLINSGALDELYNSRQSMRITTKSALQYAELTYSTDGQMSIGISSIAPPKMNEETDRPMDNLLYEYDTIGVMLSANPLEFKKEQLDKLKVKSIKDIEGLYNTTIAGVIKNVKNIKTKKNEQMAVVTIFDSSDEINVTVFPRLFDTVKGYLIRNNIIVIKGRLDRNDPNSFIADTLEKLED